MSLGIEGTIGLGLASVDQTMELTITVEGMHCGGCEQTVEDALREVDGVTDASADRDAEAATVSGSADVEALVTAVEQAGYRARA